MKNYTAKEIASRLAERVEAVAAYLLPNGKKSGHEWRAGSVFGDAGESLGVHLTGSKAGVWADFATGQSGDLLNLWAENRRLSLLEAILEAKQWLGLGYTSQINLEPPKAFKRPSPDLVVNPFFEQSKAGIYLYNDRKLEIQTLRAFQVYENGPEIVFPFYRDGELLQRKYLNLQRKDGKKVIRTEANCEPCLFGWQALKPDAREIVICEGEIDAMTLHQWGFNALSVPFGGGSGAKHQWIAQEFDRLAIFDKIYICMDNDAVGQQAAQDILERLGRHRCFLVTLPHKDANACLQAGISQAAIEDCFFKAKSCDPKELRSASSFVAEVIHEFYGKSEEEKGYLAPWAKAKGRIAFRPDELSIWTGTNGHGKSQLLGHVMLSTMRQGGRVCVASLELKPQRLLARLTRQAAALEQPTEGYIHAIHDWYQDKLWLFDLLGNAKSERLLDVFRYARQRYDVNVFVIDSMMKLDIAEDDYKGQKRFLEQLCDFKNEFNCHVHLVVHPRKALDESKWPSKLDAKGTGAITDLADNCFTVWRNKKKEEDMQVFQADKKPVPKDLEEKIDCLWICDKQRNGDFEGKLGLWFDKASLQYLNSFDHKPKPYVPYSDPIKTNS